MSSESPRETGTSPTKPGEITVSVRTIDCIACSPLLYRGLRRIPGVLEVKDLPMLNRLIVVYDTGQWDRHAMHLKINEVAKTAGLDGKILFDSRW